MEKKLTLKERIKAQETKAGKLLMRVCAIAGVIIAACGEYAQYMNFIPEGYIPAWVKGIIGISAIAGVVIGKLSVDKTKLGILVITGCVLVMGCSPKTAPLTSKTETARERDSLRDKSKADSIHESHTETISKKILAGATTGITLTESDLNSLPVALAQLPQGHQQIVVQDPKLKAQLRIYKDSLNRIHIECQARDQEYYEKSVKDEKYISSLVNELTKVKEENHTLKETVLIQKQTVWQRLVAFLDHGVWWIIIVVVASGVIILITKIKNLKLR